MEIISGKGLNKYFNKPLVYEQDYQEGSWYLENGEDRFYWNWSFFLKLKVKINNFKLPQNLNLENQLFEPLGFTE